MQFIIIYWERKQKLLLTDTHTKWNVTSEFRRVLHTRLGYGTTNYYQVYDVILLIIDTDYITYADNLLAEEYIYHVLSSIARNRKS